MSSSRTIAILIPSLNPESRLVDLVAALRNLCDYPILLVDDGSRAENRRYFEEAAKQADVTVLRHSVNLGKGRALKTGFNEFLLRYPDGIGVCTADGDGQHLPEDIVRCCDALCRNPGSLVLGVRDFSAPDVPWKSYFGNTVTRNVFRVAGLKITDTQTGLRGMGIDFMKKLMNSFGERFEFETVMLLDAVQYGVPFHEVTIQTVYLDGNSETHFNPFADSVKIYKVILRRVLGQFCKFVVSGLLSFGVDIGLFSLLYYVIVPRIELPLLITSTGVARACSLSVNYLLNRDFVFKPGAGKFGKWYSFGGYLLLCGVIFCLSYGLTKGILRLFPDGNAVLCKTLADIFCFFVSFTVQKKLIFPHRAS